MWLRMQSQQIPRRLQEYEHVHIDLFWSILHSIGLWVGERLKKGNYWFESHYFVHGQKGTPSVHYGDFCYRVNTEPPRKQRFTQGTQWTTSNRFRFNQNEKIRLYARDEDGDAPLKHYRLRFMWKRWRFWSLLRSWLRPHRGVSQERLPIYVGFFQFVHNVRRRGKALLRSLVEALVATNPETE